MSHSRLLALEDGCNWMLPSLANDVMMWRRLWWVSKWEEAYMVQYSCGGEGRRTSGSCEIKEMIIKLDKEVG